MGIGIMIPGAHFTDERYIVGKVKIPEKPVPECEHVYDNDCDATCNLCGATRTAQHNYVDGFCSVCGMRDPDNPYTIAEYPVTDGLKGLYDLGSATENGSLYNHANPSLAPTLVDTNSTFVEEEKWAAFSGASNKCRIDTNIQQTLAQGVTWVALFSVPVAGIDRPIIGNRRVSGDTTPKYGLNLGFKAVQYCVDGEGQVVYYDTPIASNNFAILALTANTNGWKVCRYSNGSLGEPLKFYEGAVDPWTTIETIRIGGDQLPSSSQGAHISLVAIHEGVMTDKQLTDICKFVKNYGEQKGLTIE